MLAQVRKVELRDRIAGAKTARGMELSELKTLHDKAREALISRQGAEKVKMKEARRVARQPKRGKRGMSKSRDKPERRREAERKKPERKQRQRDREAGWEL